MFGSAAETSYPFGSNYQNGFQECCTCRKFPTYSLHKATNQARVWLNGKSYYLGAYGSVDSRIKYAKLLKQHAAGAPVDPSKPTAGPEDEGPTVNVIVAAFLALAETY